MAYDNNPDDPLAAVARRYAVAVTDHVKSTITAPDDPVARQYLPDARELIATPDENPDPIGDDAHSPVPGIVHRYPDRVLLMPVKACAVYCRFCFRREQVGPGQKTLTPAELTAALDYIRATPAIWEVILSGGDPFVLSPRRLAALLDDLESIPHVQVIRFHTRVPVADPKRVTPDLCAALRRRKAVYVAIHTNHAQELTPEAETAFAALRTADCVLISQTVLLKDVNDTPEALENLFRRLVALRVKPYYLHHPDLAPGTGHFRMDLPTGQKIVQDLRARRLSGLCLPSYVLDIPGGHGKVPVSIGATSPGPDGGHIIRDPAGREHKYP